MKQINVFADDQVGVLADISYLFGKAKINLVAISISSAGGKAVISLTVNDPERAKQLLEASHYKVLTSDVLVARLPDRPGELAKMSKILADANISILSATIMTKGNDYALLALRVDNQKKAEKLLSDYLQKE